MSDRDSQREPRTAVLVRAVIAIPSRQEHIERRIRNLSLHGACVDHAGELTVGRTYRIEIGCAPAIGAEVMWMTDKLAGLRFATEIALDAARRPRSKLASAGGVRTGTGTDPYR